MLEANTAYWDAARFPQIKRIIFDNTLSQKEAMELVKTSEGRVDVVNEISPLDTLRVAESPFGKVVKGRGSLRLVFGHFNMLKAGSPWRDVRLRQAVNYAINREDLIRYATKGNGVIIPAMLPKHSLGHDPDLLPYAFDQDKARRLFREAGYPQGMHVSLIASEDLHVQATVVSKMLEHVGLTVDLQILDTSALNKKTLLSHLEEPVEKQTWDIALSNFFDLINFPVFEPYNSLALGGQYDWVIEQPELRQLYDQVFHTVNRDRQQALIRQMERHTHEYAYFLFLYNPLQLYAVNKDVAFIPYVNILNFAETSVTNQHWSMRKQKATLRE